MKLFIDYGGTNFRYIVKNEDLLLEEKSLKSNSVLLKEFLIKKLEAYPDISFIGIAFGGQVKDGVILSAPNIQTDEFDIKSYFESNYDLRLEIDNDLKTAALAQMQIFDANESLVLLYMGTGLGSCFVDRGKIVRGFSNLAGEIGHIRYKDSPFVCGCGKDDCLELFASGSALQKWINHFALGIEPTLEALNLSKSPKAYVILQNFHDATAFAASMLVTLLNPSKLILGGGVFKNNPYLKEMIEKEISKKSMKKSAQDTKVMLSTLSNANLVGAQLLENYKKELNE